MNGRSCGDIGRSSIRDGYRGADEWTHRRRLRQVNRQSLGTHSNSKRDGA